MGFIIEFDGNSYDSDTITNEQKEALSAYSEETYNILFNTNECKLGRACTSEVACQYCPDRIEQ
jgi:hypothetical protein